MPAAVVRSLGVLSVVAVATAYGLFSTFVLVKDPATTFGGPGWIFAWFVIPAFIYLAATGLPMPVEDGGRKRLLQCGLGGLFTMAVVVLQRHPWISDGAPPLKNPVIIVLQLFVYVFFFLIGFGLVALGTWIESKVRSARI